jgi:hypothetical protein
MEKIYVGSIGLIVSGGDDQWSLLPNTTVLFDDSLDYTLCKPNTIEWSGLMSKALYSGRPVYITKTLKYILCLSHYNDKNDAFIPLSPALVKILYNKVITKKALIQFHKELYGVGG